MNLFYIKNNNNNYYLYILYIYITYNIILII